MSNSPFVFGKVVSNQGFTNRLIEKKRLEDNLTSGVNTMIISPRRWGKSSLVAHVIYNLRRSKTHIPVSIDLFSVATEEDFLQLFAKKIIQASSSRWEDWVRYSKDVFKQLIPKITLGADPMTEFNLSFDWSELKQHREEILNLPEILAKKKKIKLIICLDEFQNIAEFKDFPHFEKSMRSVWQRQKNVTYCLYGSKRHMMNEIFSDSSKPFYRFGDILFLKKISETDWVSYITRSFKKTGKSMTKSTATTIANLMSNHPWYVQQLSHYVWLHTKVKTQDDELAMALEDLLNATVPFHQQLISALSRTQINLLVAIANKDKQLTARATMRKYGLGTPRNVNKNESVLMKKDIIHKPNDHYEFLDPVFELWFLQEWVAK